MKIAGRRHHPTRGAHTTLCLRIRFPVAAASHLGVGHVHNVLVSLDALHDVEAVAVQHLGLSAARHHQDDVTGDTVLQGLDLVARGKHTHTHKQHQSGQFVNDFSIF